MPHAGSKKFKKSYPSIHLPQIQTAANDAASALLASDEAKGKLKDWMKGHLTDAANKILGSTLNVEMLLLLTYLAKRKPLSVKK
jgi:hypothetical protein